MTGYTHENLPGNFDGVTFVNRDVAANNDTTMGISDGRLILHPWFSLNIACWPGTTDTLNNRPRLKFNGNGGAVYEASFRAFVNQSDTPPATEAPSISHLKDQTYFPLLPPDANFDLTALDMCFAAKLDVMRLDQTEDYRIFCWWSRGTSGPSAHPRHGFTVGNFAGGGANGISIVDVTLGASGKLGAGSFIEGFSMQSSILGGGFVYKAAKLPTGKVWVDGRPVYRYCMLDLALPSPGNLIEHNLPFSGHDVATTRCVELWGYDLSPLQSWRLSQLHVKFSSTKLTFTSLGSHEDLSPFLANAVIEFSDQL